VAKETISPPSALMKAFASTVPVFACPSSKKPFLEGDPLLLGDHAIAVRVDLVHQSLAMQARA